MAGLHALAGATMIAPLQPGRQRGRHPGGGIRSLLLGGLLATVLLPAHPGHAEGQPSPEAGTSLTALVPADLPTVLLQQPGRHLVLLRRQKKLLLLEDGRVLRGFPVAVGMPGWETPTGRFQVREMVRHPVWEHPQSGSLRHPGPDNPLGSRWIGFHRDCEGRRGWDGEQMLDVAGCVVTGFHGTPHRWTVGRAVSHGCVRLYDEDVQALFDMVAVGTDVTVLP